MGAWVAEWLAKNVLRGARAVSWAWLVWFVAAVLLALFAGQNANLVVIRFLGWEIRTYQALVILGAAVAGVVLTVLSTLPQRVRSYLRSSDLQSQLRRLGQERQALDEKLRRAEEEVRALTEKLKMAEERARRAEELLEKPGAEGPSGPAPQPPGRTPQGAPGGS